MNEFAVDLGRDDGAAARKILAGVTFWHRPEGRDYYMARLEGNEHPLLEGCRRAFFLKVEPGGHIHRHRDAAGEVFDTDLIVAKTNPQCLVFWQDGEDERSMHLALGRRYRMQERGVPHWSYNRGRTDRVHLLIEYPK